MTDLETLRELHAYLLKRIEHYNAQVNCGDWTVRPEAEAMSVECTQYADALQHAIKELERKEQTP